MDGLPDIVAGNNEGILVHLLEDANSFQFLREDYFYNGWGGPFDIVDVDNDSDLNVVASSTALPGIIHYNNLTINTTSAHKISNNFIQIYPNPVSQFLNKDVPGSLDYQVQLYDINGKLISSQIDYQPIDVSSLQNGIYILEVKDVNSNQKVIKKVFVTQ